MLPAVVNEQSLRSRLHDEQTVAVGGFEGPNKLRMQHLPPMADPPSMEHTPDHLPELTPPEGVLEMVCTEFFDEPEQMQAYAVFAGRVDAFLNVRGLRGWEMLDVERFLSQSARTRPEAATLCCMLATVLPWMVRARDLSRSQAVRKCVVMLEVCAQDPQARSCIQRATDALGEADGLAAIWRSH